MYSAYLVKIEDKKTFSCKPSEDRKISQINNFLDLYMGESGMNLIAENIEDNSNEYFGIIGEFVLDTWKKMTPEEFKKYCFALVFEDENGFITDIYYISSNDTLYHPQR